MVGSHGVMLQRHGGKCDTLCRIFGSVGASKRAVAASSDRALRERKARAQPRTEA